MARGSLLETKEHIFVAFDEKYIDNEVLTNFLAKIELCGKLLNGYINYLKINQKPKEEDCFG